MTKLLKVFLVPVVKKHWWHNYGLNLKAFLSRLGEFYHLFLCHSLVL